MSSDAPVPTQLGVYDILSKIAEGGSFPVARLSYGRAFREFLGELESDEFREAFEKKFAHEEELRFKANARRNQLAGNWAAGKLGLVGKDGEDYANAIVALDIDKPGSDAVFEKIHSDLKREGVVQSEHQIRRTLDDFTRRAVADTKAE